MSIKKIFFLCEWHKRKRIDLSSLNTKLTETKVHRKESIFTKINTVHENICNCEGLFADHSKMKLFEVARIFTIVYTIIYIYTLQKITRTLVTAP